MRPGAAVRLKGTWVDETGKKSPCDKSVETSDTKGEGETSISPDQPELKVSEVEILGGSDPMVRMSRMSRISQYVRIPFLQMSRHTRSRTNISLLKVSAQFPIFARELLSTQLCCAYDQMPLLCSHNSSSVSDFNRHTLLSLPHRIVKARARLSLSRHHLQTSSLGIPNISQFPLNSTWRLLPKLLVMSGPCLQLSGLSRVTRRGISASSTC